MSDLEDDLRAERALLAELLGAGDERIDKCFALIRNADFSGKRERATFEAIARLRARGDPVDLVTISHEMRGIGDASAFMAALTNEPTTYGASIEHRARIVAERAARRRTGNALQGMRRELAAGADLETIAQQLRTAAERALPSLQHQPAPSERLAWLPYPLDALPRSIRELAREGAAAIGCDPSVVALASLVVCAGAIGLSRRVRIKPGKLGWREVAILWAALVMESGERKSPALDMAGDPLRDLEAAARRAHKRALRRWQRECDTERIAARSEKRAPDLPEKPTERRYIVRDTTIEALSTVLDENPRGVVGIRDELRNWFESWTRYGDGVSSAGQWLELYGGRALRADRADPTRCAYVSHAGVSVVGTVQPATLRRCLTGEHLESGCGARILFAAPPRQPRRWTDATVKDATFDSYARVVRALTLLDLDSTRDKDGEAVQGPRDLDLTPQSRELMHAWVDELGAESWSCDGPEAASASKIEGGAARLALVIALVEGAEGELATRALAAEDAALEAEASARECERVAGEAPDDLTRQGAATAAEAIAQDAKRAAERARADWGRAVATVGTSAMERGIKLARWHWIEARRVLAMLDDDDAGEDREQRRLVAWLARHGDEGATAREVACGLRRFRGAGGAERAEAALAKLVESGAVKRLSGPRTVRYQAALTDSDRPGGDAERSGDSGGGCTSGPGGLGEAESADADGADTSQVPPRRKRWSAGAERPR